MSRIWLPRCTAAPEYYFFKHNQFFKLRPIIENMADSDIKFMMFLDWLECYYKLNLRKDKRK